MPQPLNPDNMSDEELLEQADERLKKQGVDPHAPATTEDGEESDLNPPDEEEETPIKPKVTVENLDDTPVTKEGSQTATATDETGETITFKNKAELATFVQEQLATLNSGNTTTEEKKDAKEALDSVKFVEEDWKPANWNEAFKFIMENVAPKMREQFREQDAQEKQKTEAELKSINDDFDKEYDGLATQYKLPARTTPEGAEVNRALADFAAKNGLVTYTQAYNLWSKIPKEQGGGFGAAPVKKVNPSKAAARKIGSSQNGDAAAKGKGKAYSTVHTKSMDQLLEEEL